MVFGSISTLKVSEHLKTDTATDVPANTPETVDRLRAVATLTNSVQTQLCAKSHRSPSDLTLILFANAANGTNDRRPQPVDATHSANFSAGV